MNFFDRLSQLQHQKAKNAPEDHGEKAPLEKGDMPALIIAALITFLPVLAVLGLVTLGVMKFFGAI